MPKFKKLCLGDYLELFEYLKDHTFKEAAAHFSKREGRPVSEGAVRSRSSRGAKAFAEAQTELNKLRTLQRISRRIRKITTLGAIEKTDNDDMEGQQ